MNLVQAVLDRLKL
jgi:hypothetical protein